MTSQSRLIDRRNQAGAGNAVNSNGGVAGALTGFPLVSDSCPQRNHRGDLNFPVHAASMVRCAYQIRPMIVRTAYPTLLGATAGLPSRGTRHDYSACRSMSYRPTTPTSACDMSTAIRVFGAIVGAIAASFALLIAVELFSSVVHPFPPDFDGTPEEMCAHVAWYPHWVLAAVVPMWGGTAFVGTWIAGRFGNRISAIFLALLLLAAVTLNLVMLPYPLWFKISQPLAILIAVIVAYQASCNETSSGGGEHG